MKKLLFLLCLLIPSIAFAWGISGVLSGGAPAGTPGGSCAYVHCNGLEAQADDDDWTTVAGSPDYDDTTFSYEGTEDLKLVAGASASIAVTARAETWITFYIHTNDNNESTESLILLYNDSTLLATVMYEFDNKWKIEAEGGSTSATETVNINTGTDWIKLRFKQGTGANAEIEFWASSDGQNWANNLSITDGTTTAQVNKVLFQNTHDNEIMFIDHFLENNADITDAR